MRTFSVSQPRYAPRRARLKLSLTRSVTSAAALAALALVCGPALESAGDPNPAQVAAVGAAEPAGVAEAVGGTDASSQPAQAQWSGPLPIRPSRFATVPAGSVTDAPAIEAAVLGPAGTVGALGIPLMVLRAYHQAADRLAVQQPSCKLPWWLLAGIGHTESGHAESGRLTADGTTRGRILGPRLNGGIAGDAIITDTDKGSYDGDKVYDRAVGPMQFIPSTWVHWGVDGNADGKIDPSNIFDATLAAGHYLCADGRNLSTAAGLRAAVLSYNHSAPYLATVLAWGTAYRDGTAALPDSPLPVISDVTKVRPPKSSRPPKRTTKPSKLPSAGPTAAPSSSAPSSAAPSSAAPSSSAPASGSAGPSKSTSGSASPSATASCTSASPSPTDSASATASGDATPSAAAQSLSGKAGSGSSANASSTGSATPGRPDGSATSGSVASKASAGAAASTPVSSASTARAAGAQSSTASSTSSSASASPSSSSCAP
jgi:membrane-bound lytic murein transglycosylase B